MFKWLVAKFIYLLAGRRMSVLLWFFRRQGIKIGAGCNIYSNICTTEPYLVEIGKNTTISNDVQILTHDSSIGKVLPQHTDLFGKVVVGDNCFIGARSILLPGVKIASNVIVGSGSVVSKSVLEEFSVVAGNPARVVGNFDKLANKFASKGFNVYGLSSAEKKKMILSNLNFLILK